MIILDCEQGTEEWFLARCGRVTASAMDKIITPTGKKSTQYKTYMNKLLAEWMTNSPTESENTEWMQRGKELEDEARKYYEFETDRDVQQVGLVYKDDSKLVSCSPDGLINVERGLEIKVPAPHTHVGYLLSGFPNQYTPQLQSSMYVCDLDKWDFISYNPDMEPLLVEVVRDDGYLEKVNSYLSEFLDEMLEKREILSKQKEAA